MQPVRFTRISVTIGDLMKESKIIARAAVALFAIIFISLLAGADLLYGIVTDTAQIRRDAGKFRAEVGYLRVDTLSLLPNLKHKYRVDNPDGSASTRILQTDALGTIKPENPIGHAQTSILFLGGSTTETNEVGEKFRFPAVVQKEIRATGLDVRTINAGVRGHTTQNSLIAYLAHPTYRDAEIVVMMHNINDRLWLAARQSYSGQLPQEGATTWNNLWRSAHGFTMTMWEFVTYHSNLVFSLRTWLENFHPWTGERKLPQGAVVKETINQGATSAREDVKAFVRNLNTFVAMVRANGNLPVLMTQALGIQSEAQDTFNQAIRDSAHANNVPLIDLARHLSGDGGWAFLGDSIHLNDRGSQAVGELASTALANLLGKSVSQGPIDKGFSTVSEVMTACARKPKGDKFQPGKPIQIVGAGGRYPSFSKDGNWLLFQKDLGGRERLAAMAVKTGKIIILTPDSSDVNERHPAFLSVHPGKFTVVFASGFKKNNSNLERLKIRHWPSMETTELGISSELGGAIPTVTAEQIIFPGFTNNGRDQVPDLYSFDRTENKLLRLTNSPYEEWRPAVAPSGDIYFIANKTGNFDIYRLKLGAKGPHLVYGSDADEWDPAVSPNGKWLVFATKRTGNWDLLLMELASGRIVSLTDGPAEDWDPQFHPNGNMITFARSRGVEPQIFALCPFGSR